MTESFSVPLHRKPKATPLSLALASPHTRRHFQSVGASRKARRVKVTRLADKLHIDDRAQADHFNIRMSSSDILPFKMFLNM